MTYSAAKVIRLSEFNLVANTWTELAFEDITLESWSWWDINNPSRFVVPQGISFAELVFANNVTALPSTATDSAVEFVRNRNSVESRISFTQAFDNPQVIGAPVSSGPFMVQAGDELFVRIWANSDMTLQPITTYFTVEGWAG